MKSELFERYELLKARGLTEEQDRRMLEEISSGDNAHILFDDDGRSSSSRSRPSSIYGYHDLLRSYPEYAGYADLPGQSASLDR